MLSEARIGEGFSEIWNIAWVDYSIVILYVELIMSFALY